MLACSRAQQAYVAARQAREQAERVLIYGAEASALLAHDLNNGLSIALSNMVYLSEKLALDADDRSAMDAAVAALGRMAGLVANFVDVGRFEDAELVPQRATVRVRELIEQVLQIHRSVLGAGVQLTVECEPGLTASADPALIERVLHNLVGNATRYCAKGGAITLRALAAAPGVEILVINSGPPIPDEVLPRLFSKYARGSGGKRGLGLYFCRLACEAHGGTITVENQPGGVAFRIRLPA
jgi:signal transduction histidine kinase